MSYLTDTMNFCLGIKDKQYFNCPNYKATVYPKLNKFECILF